GDAGVRQSALRTLGGLGPDGAAAVVPVLIGRLNSADRETRLSAVHALSRSGSAARPALPKLLELAADKDVDLRVAALAALTAVQVNDPKVLAALTKGLDDEQPGVRRVSAAGLTQAGADGLPALRRVAAAP